MQMQDEKNIEERTTYYSSKVISRETKRGIKYKDIKQVIMINILDYEMLGFDEYISETVTVLDKHRDFELIKGVKWYFIELPKFRKSNPDMNDKINQWLAFIDDYDKELVQMAEKKNKTLKEAGIEIYTLTGDEEVQRLAELREKWEMDRISEIGYVKREVKQSILKKLIKMGKNHEEIMEIMDIPKEEEHIINEMEEKLKNNVENQDEIEK